MPKHITIPACNDLYDEARNEFVSTKETTLMLEHSLVAISKWESKHHKVWLGYPHTDEEVIDYIKDMTITQNVDPNVYRVMPSSVIKEIADYINDPMTASRVNDSRHNKSTGEDVTSELIYYWMLVNGIPDRFEKWHLNRLMMLIRICSAKNNPKKMSTHEILAQNRALNRSRRAKTHSRG